MAQKKARMIVCHGENTKMTPQNRLVVLTYLITIKVIEFQNFAESGAD
jgi:hypothetical protein